MAEPQEIEQQIADNQLHNQQYVSAGQVLQAAREAKKLTQQDISNSLRYSVKQIDALEKGDYDALPDAMITRGFIRSYAKLLEIDAEPLLTSYREVVSTQPERMIAVKSSMRPVQLTKESQPWLKYILGSILVLLFLLAWLFYVDYMPKSSPAVVENTAQVAEKAASVEALPEVALPAAQRSAEDGTVSDLTSGTDASVNAPSEPPADLEGNSIDTKPPVAFAQPESQSLPQAVPPQTATAAIADKALVMTFSALSWVSVNDKSGKVVYEKVSHSGDTVTVHALPPLRLVIGNASGTKLNFDGKDVDLAPSTKDNVARITLE